MSARVVRHTYNASLFTGPKTAYVRSLCGLDRFWCAGNNVVYRIGQRSPSRARGCKRCTRRAVTLRKAAGEGR